MKHIKNNQRAIFLFGLRLLPVLEFYCPKITGFATLWLLINVEFDGSPFVDMFNGFYIVTKLLYWCFPLPAKNVLAAPVNPALLPPCRPRLEPPELMIMLL